MQNALYFIQILGYSLYLRRFLCGIGPGNNKIQLHCMTTRLYILAELILRAISIPLFDKQGDTKCSENQTIKDGSNRYVP